LEEIYDADWGGGDNGETGKAEIRMNSRHWYIIEEEEQEDENMADEKKKAKERKGIYCRPSPEVIEYFQLQAEKNRRALPDEVGLFLDETMIPIIRAGKEAGITSGTDDVRDGI
jgi:hypothetical protein